MCFILHIFDCDEWEWCELEWGEFGRGECDLPLRRIIPYQV